MTTRRWVLGGGVAAAAVAGLGYRAWERGVFSSGEGPAYAPWAEWPAPAAEGLKGAVRAAVLAANAHDTQPWLFGLHADGVDVYADRARNLGTFDPFRREMQLSVGAAIANLLMAASVSGYSVNRYEVTAGRLALSPPDAAMLVTRIGFVRTGQTTPRLQLLAASIPRRHTNRFAYDPGRRIARVVLDAIISPAQQQNVAVAFITDPGARKEFGSLIVEATQRIIDDRDMSNDSARWFRAGLDEVNERRDGITVDASGASPVMRMAAKMLPDLGASSADSAWLSMTRDTQVATAPVFGMLLVKDRFDMATALTAGQCWQLMHLSATSLKLAAQPMNQPVECMDRNAMLGRRDVYAGELAKFAKLPGWEPTFVFRLGVPMEEAPASPRRPLADVLRA